MNVVVSTAPQTEAVSEWVVWTEARSYVVDGSDHTVTAIPADWDTADASHSGWSADEFVTRPIPPSVDASALLVLGQPLPADLTGGDSSPVVRVESSAL